MLLFPIFDNMTCAIDCTQMGFVFRRIIPPIHLCRRGSNRLPPVHEHQNLSLPCDQLRIVVGKRTVRLLGKSFKC